MSWIGTKSSPQSKTVTKAAVTPAAQRPVSKEPSSLEAATVVSVRGTPPANAIVEHVTAHECRLRCVVLFDVGAKMEFDLNLPGRAPVSIHGRVASRTPRGPRFIYRVTFERMTTRETDDLARTLAESHRGQSRLRPLETLKDLPTTDGLTRKNLRLESDFSLQYRTHKEGFKGAKAANISTGGLMMTCGDALVEGMHLELIFRLPSDVLEIYPEETTVLDLRAPLKRKTVPSKLRRPFGDMVVQARVAFHEPLGGGLYKYGVSFANLARADREEIARYVDAVRHAKLRRR